MRCVEIRIGIRRYTDSTPRNSYREFCRTRAVRAFVLRARCVTRPGVARLRIACNADHELEKRCRGASSSLSSLSAPEWLAYCSMKDLKIALSPRVKVFLVGRGEQLISSLRTEQEPACSEFGTANIASSILHQPVTTSTERRSQP
jgi:hypothetical protein